MSPRCWLVTARYNYVMDGDLPVGLIGDAVFHSIQCDFPVGSRLCILTDGISETENRAGEEFGTCRVEPCSLSDEPVRALCQTLLLSLTIWKHRTIAPSWYWRGRDRSDSPPRCRLRKEPPGCFG